MDAEASKRFATAIQEDALFWWTVFHELLQLQCRLLPQRASSQLPTLAQDAHTGRQWLPYVQFQICDTEICSFTGPCTRVVKEQQ